MNFSKWKKLSLLTIFIFAISVFFLQVRAENKRSFSSQDRISLLYASLDPLSIGQHLAFYSLYHTHPYGQKSLEDLKNLLKIPETFSVSPFILNTSLVASLIDVFSHLNEKNLYFSFADLQHVEHISAFLPHKHLKGHFLEREDDILLLEEPEIDMSRALLIAQFKGDILKVRSYEALLDIMALQILARLPSMASPYDKIDAINHFLFYEMAFRFPPYSLYTKEVDAYTFLSSVLDRRKGVCLGVVVLYLSLAQRLNLQLEIITPPGHIYLRYVDGDKVINIETTARGIHLSDEEYLGITHHALQKRTLKETIGLVFVNAAACYWQKEAYEETLAYYHKALPYLSQDPLLKELMGYSYLLVGEREKGRELLASIRNIQSPYSISKVALIEDYFLEKVDESGIKAVFKQVDETRQSLLEKKRELEQVLEKFPFFRYGIFQLAITWLQLYRTDKAVDCLESYQALDPEDLEVNYYLSALFLERLYYSKAWEHWHIANKLVTQKKYHPKALKELRRALLKCSADPF